MQLHLIKTILSMIKDRKCKVTLNGVTSNIVFTISKGLQQGTVNSPFLFNIYTADLPKLFGINNREIKIIYISNISLKGIK